LARTVKQDQHTAKRNEILDAALQLVYSRGYGRMTIQDILERLQISKGAFYHYFDSKAAVLEALVERMVTEQVEPLLIAAVQNPHLTALEKLQAYFDTAVRWKTAEKKFVMELVRVWYSDENALAREKMYAMMVAHVTPLFIEIIQQGVREGTFTTPYPEYASQMNIGLIQALGDTFAEMLLAEEKEHDHRRLLRAESMVAAYDDAIERMLGAPRGSISLMDVEALKVWFAPDDSLALQGNAAQKTNDTARSPSLK
jgi:AcrR family transcriptional regulator